MRDQSPLYLQAPEATRCKAGPTEQAMQWRVEASSPGIDEAEGEEPDAGPQQDALGEQQAASGWAVVVVRWLLRAARPEAAARERVRQRGHGRGRGRRRGGSDGAGAGVPPQHAVRLRGAH